MQTDQETLKKTRRVNTPILPGIEDRFNQFVAAFADRQTEPQLAATALAAGLGDRDLLNTLIKERKTLQDIAAAIDALQAKPTGTDCMPAIKHIGDEIARVQHEHLAMLKKLELSQETVREECASCSRTQIEALALVAVSLKKLIDQPCPVHPDHGDAISAIAAKIDAMKPDSATKPKRDPILFGAVALACIMAATACFTRFAPLPASVPPALTTNSLPLHPVIEGSDPCFLRAQNNARLEALVASSNSNNPSK